MHHLIAVLHTAQAGLGECRHNLGSCHRYFLHNWPSLCFLAFDRGHCFGTVICKLDDHNGMLRGYLAMLVVEQAYRGHGAGKERVIHPILLLLLLLLLTEPVQMDQWPDSVQSC